MEPKFRTSFIPKDKLRAAASVTKKHGGSLGLITLATLILAVGAVALSVGAFLYQEFLSSSISRKSETLNRARAAFEPALIQELVRLDSRIESAEAIIDNHLAPSAFFNVLEDNTLKSVQFREFNFTRIGDDKIGISMRGVAEDFRGVALQADLFGKSKVIKDPIFSNLNLDQNGKAIFSVSAFVDPALINFNSVGAEVGTGATNN